MLKRWAGRRSSKGRQGSAGAKDEQRGRQSAPVSAFAQGAVIRCAGWLHCRPGSRKARRLCACVSRAAATLASFCTAAACRGREAFWSAGYVMCCWALHSQHHRTREAPSEWPCLLYKTAQDSTAWASALCMLNARHAFLCDTASLLSICCCRRRQCFRVKRAGGAAPGRRGPSVPAGRVRELVPYASCLLRHPRYVKPSC